MIKLSCFLALFAFLSVFSCGVISGDKGASDTENNKPSDDMDTTTDLADYQNLFDTQKIHEFEIVISQNEWDGLLQDMKDYASKFGSLFDGKPNYRTGNYRKAKLIYKGCNGDKQLSEVGFRTRGNTTRVLPENPSGTFHSTNFALKFNETFDMSENSSEYDKRKDRRLFNLRSLNLKRAADDPTLIRELYSYKFMNDAGVYAPKTGSAKLYITIDGERHYFGVYTIIEPVNKSFLTRRYDKSGNDGNMYKCLWQQYGAATLDTKSVNMSNAIGVEKWETNYRPSYDRVTNEDDRDYSDLKDFADKLKSLSGSELKNYIDNNFEVDRFLRWIACNMILGMPDDYWNMGNNYYLYFGSKIEFIPYDYDHGLGGGWHPFDTANADIYKWNSQSGSAVLVTKLLEISEYKTKYKEYLGSLTNPETGEFTFEKYSAFFNAMKTLYTGTDALNSTIDGDLSMKIDETTENYINNRIKSIKNQL